MIRVLLQLVLSAIVPGLIYFFYKTQLLIEVLGVHVMLPAIAIAGLLGTLFPKVFAMGVQGFRKAGFLKRTLPIVYALLVVYTLKFLPQTIITAGFAGVILGNTLSYTGFIIGSAISKGGKK